MDHRAKQLVALTIAAAVAGTIYGVLLANQPPGTIHATRLWLQGAMHGATAACYAGATWYGVKIAADYPDSSAMKLAWRLIAAHAVFALLRHAYESLAVATGWMTGQATTLATLRQIPIVVSLILLAAGLVAMWSSFTAIGIGLRFRMGDYLLLGLILALVPLILSQQQEMVDSRSSYSFIRRLQAASPGLLAVPAAVSLILHRISREIGGGQLALSLRLLALFLLMRMLSLFLSLFPEWAILTVLSRTTFWATPWMFLLAVFYRWRLTVSASELAGRYEMDPARELSVVKTQL
jgi:hypothetical protein